MHIPLKDGKLCDTCPIQSSEENLESVIYQLLLAGACQVSCGNKLHACADQESGQIMSESKGKVEDEDKDTHAQTLSQKEK